MLLRLFLLLVTVPLVETTLLLFLADRLGFVATFGIVIATGVMGAGLLRQQGLQAMARVRAQVNQGRLPATELLDGVMILVAGVLLLTPGVLTDICGLVLLIPLSRTWIRGWLVRWFKSRWHLQAFADRTTADGEWRSEVIDSYVVPPGEDRDHP